MATFVIETYLARQHADRLPEAVARLQTVIEARSGGGTVRYVRSVFIPEDETCFHVIEAASARVARELCRRARIPAERVVEAEAMEAPPDR